ncbi:uncharacterized protein LOC123537312 [Mercenaria mercenaria]|uniref:uncharacterized protein LOC123537312 n=1 Tax=Mercenaria mercenaria TaxID=6596 RepID=UPI001E1D35D2|nr:uncharacterized protein LOC123537312 [Mercenaria mercenaria]
MRIQNRTSFKVEEETDLSRRCEIGWKLKIFTMIRLKRPTIFDAAMLFSGLVAFVLHVLGTAFPYWWVVHEREDETITLTFYYGIWVIIDCRNDTCVTTSSRMNGDRAWLIGPAVLIILADLLLLVVVLFTCRYIVYEKHGLVFRKLCVLLSSGAGGVIILAVLIFYKKKAGLRPSQAPETSDGDPSWALLLSSMASIIAVLHGVVSGCYANKMWKKGEDKRPKTVFGIDAGELEVNVNALRRGELSCGKNINRLESVKEESDWKY